MTRSRVGIIVLLGGCLAAPLAAEEPVAVLVPVFASEPIPGVNGSSWVTDLWVSSGDASATVTGIVWDCSLPECNFPAPFDPEVTMLTGPLAGDSLHGSLIYLDASTADDVHFGLRFRDLSRQATTAGTTLPTPTQTAFQQTPFSIVGVPVTAGFRQTLRIYELDGTPREASVRVRTYRLDPERRIPHGDPDVLLGETTLPLSFTPFLTERPEHPGYAQITDLSTIAPLGDAQSVRLEIEPATDGLRLWAFATIIHNESQHATVIPP